MGVTSNIQQLIIIAQDCVKKKQYDKALSVIEQVLMVDCSNTTALYVKAVIYICLGNYIQAEEILLLAITLDLNNVSFLMKLYDCYCHQQKYNQALEVVTRVREIIPNDVYALKSYILILRKLGRVEECIVAINLLKEVVVANPKSTQVIMILADLCFIFGQYEEAEKYYGMVYEVDPDNNELALFRLACLLHNSFDKDGKERLTKANEVANKLLDISNDKMNIAQIVQDIALLSIDLELQTRLGDKRNLMKYWADTGCNKPFIYQKSRVETMQDRLDLLESHRAWGTRIETMVDRGKIKRSVCRKINNKIRLGLISADFRSNHVGGYIWPLIKNLNRDKFEIYCYAQRPEKRDIMQQESQKIVDSFKECSFEKYEHYAMAQIIADDCLDALLEIGAWHRRSETIAYKPAPLQISWLDYAHSVGLPTAIDYIVIDPYITPNLNLLIEKPMILPETWITIDEEGGFFPTPITEILPEDLNGYITFGAMNATYRFTEETFKVWAAIMSMVPNSRFIYIRPESIAELVQDNFYRYMEKYGINRDRISFIAKRMDFMKHYNRIDIALDTFPHMGATTTCYTLWMGLPLVTLVGPCFFERISYSALNNCGLGDLCAFNLQEYHNIALSLVADKERRRYIRRNLRNWILNGPLGQSKRFADNMGNAIMNVLGRG